MKKCILSSLSALLLSALLTACSAEGNTISATATCVPGAAAFCACTDGSVGSQQCTEEGVFAACVCSGDVADGDATDVDQDAIGDTAGDTSGDLPDASPDTSDTAIEVDADVPPDVPADAPTEDTIVPGTAQFGEACGADRDCESGVCRDFGGETAVCTESCVVECFEAGFVCFNRLCTPENFCDLDLGPDGTGPGCADARCGGCPENSTCEAFEFGRYDCVCATGYVGDLRGCTDIDECAEGLAACGPTTICTNNAGGYTCECAEGFYGATCLECPGGAATPCNGRGSCDDGPAGTGACDCSPRFGGATCDLDCYATSPIDCAGANITDGSVAGLSFVDAILTGATLSGLQLGGLDFTRAQCGGATFVGSGLANANLSSSYFQGANLAGSDLTGAQLFQADFTDAGLSGGVLTDVTAASAIFDGADLRSVTMRRALLTGANLSGANLSDAIMQNVNLSAAILTEVDMTRADAAVANLADADLSGGAVLFSTNFTDAILVRANLSGANMNRANLQRANLQDAVLVGADLSNADLSAAIMTDALLAGVIWSNTTCPDRTNSEFNGGTCAGHLN